MDTSSPVNFTLGLLMLCGLLFGLFASRFRFPRVAAYVAAGLVLSPDLMGKYVNITVDTWTQPLTTGALGIIAYLIGGSLTVRQARRIGKIIFGIALGQSLGAVVFVFVGLLLVLPDTATMPAWTLAMAFAAISATTAHISDHGTCRHHSRPASVSRQRSGFLDFAWRGGVRRCHRHYSFFNYAGNNHRPNTDIKLDSRLT
jgi:Kef-type K+ transport system membrane component KefB